MLVISQTSDLISLFECWRREYLGRSEGMLPHKRLKIRASKMATTDRILAGWPEVNLHGSLYALDQSVNKPFFGWNTLFTLQNILFTIHIVFQHVLQTIYLLFVGITAWKLRFFMELADFIKNTELDRKTDFYSVAAGQRV